MLKKNSEKKTIFIIKITVKVNLQGCETQMPSVVTKSKSGKISKSYILTHPIPGAFEVSEV